MATTAENIVLLQKMVSDITTISTEAVNKFKFSDWKDIVTRQVGYVDGIVTYLEKRLTVQENIYTILKSRV